MTSDDIPLQLPPIEPARGYTIGHAALYLACSIPLVYELIRKKEIASRVLGKKRRIVPGAELLRFLAGKPPVMDGDPLDKRKSELGRIGGRAGGLAKARRSAA